ncbi:MAG: hypothetical protein L6V93_10570 [Clostridiales bacterium]|nr:MAG: hypothetical protein L6V93_10570 [Clostridiales bacterium]
MNFSVKNETGIDALSEKIAQMFDMGEISDDGGETVINERHKEALAGALESINSALKTLEDGMPSDMTFVDIEKCGEQTRRGDGYERGRRNCGQNFFHSFCVGKIT